MDEIRCSVCGSVVNAGDAFCQNCGSPVTASAPAEGAETNSQADAPKQQETTVLSGNPYSQNGNDTQTAGQEMNPGAGVNYQESGATVNPTYQQPPISNMNANYQGSYSASYTQPMTSTAEVKPGKGLGIAGLILGIIGLLTSCCFGGLIFGLIGLILSIVYMTKKGSKGLGISGIIVSAIGFLISVILGIMALSGSVALKNAVDDYVPDDYQYLFDEYYDTSYDNNYDFDDIFTEDPFGDDFSDTSDFDSNSNLTGTNQILVNEIVYTLPATLSDLGLSVNPEYNSAEVASVGTDGVVPGDYRFVLLNASDGTSFWGYIENMGYDTVYTFDELSVTGINVDNYSEGCTATYVEVYGGIQLNMSRSEVEDRIGTPDYYDGGQDVYESENGNEVLRLEYEDDIVIAIDVTIYY